MKHSGYSLLEVLVSLAILLLGLAVLTQLTGLSGTASRDAEEFAIVQLAAQAKLNELLATQETIIPIAAEPVPGVDNWTISVQPTASGRPGLTALHLVAKKINNQNRTVSRYELVRWVTNDRVAPTQNSASSTSLPFAPTQQSDNSSFLASPVFQDFQNTPNITNETTFPATDFQ